MDTARWEAFKQSAEKLGTEHGTSVASWYFDGKTTAETYVKVLGMIDDGDPEFYDSRRPPLSGEYTDDMTPQRLLAELGAGDATPEEESELCDLYDQAHSQAWEDEIARVARYHTAGMDVSD
jgi:hypothetical protein